ncbi:hypothetical protein BDK51DRAFT_46505 [Blyttiomyces helicus]|uniref:Uncharacterized protein n=1 Tax=Blyttiomyces helicus TaxID=388810 RepID=A0A4P9VZT3_9FUNG|nr:hypothetical protein BDK51DRAFT_46505 [Blyttiomyces helicus]|eukprot:RKO83346.1 hypothetical protein BDK51DRAFT_46505 [Blyttiomyces helicus]
MDCHTNKLERLRADAVPSLSPHDPLYQQILLAQPRGQRGRHHLQRSGFSALSSLHSDTARNDPEILYRGDRRASPALAASRREKGMKGRLLLFSGVKWSQDGSCVKERQNHVRLIGCVAVAQLVKRVEPNERVISIVSSEDGMSRSFARSGLTRTSSTSSPDFDRKCAYFPLLLESRFCKSFLNALVGSQDPFPKDVRALFSAEGQSEIDSADGEVEAEEVDSGDDHELGEVNIGRGRAETPAAPPNPPPAQPSVPERRRNATAPKTNAFESLPIVEDSADEGNSARESTTPARLSRAPKTNPPRGVRSSTAIDNMVDSFNDQLGDLYLADRISVLETLLSRYRDESLALAIPVAPSYPVGKAIVKVILAGGL